MPQFPDSIHQLLTFQYFAIRYNAEYIKLFKYSQRGEEHRPFIIALPTLHHRNDSLHKLKQPQIHKKYDDPQIIL